jgi:3-phenylpropionate/trans-cinnamate dioxygenase ferredoxin subunit
VAIRICAVEDLAKGAYTRATLGDKTLAIFRSKDGNYHVVDDMCSHENISLTAHNQPNLEDFVHFTNDYVECPSHGAKFSFTDGTPTLPAFEPISVYEVIIENDEVFVDYEA